LGRTTDAAAGRRIPPERPNRHVRLRQSGRHAPQGRPHVLVPALPSAVAATLDWGLVSLVLQPLWREEILRRLRDRVGFGLRGGRETPLDDGKAGALGVGHSVFAAAAAPSTDSTCTTLMFLSVGMNHAKVRGGGFVGSSFRIGSELWQRQGVRRNSPMGDPRIAPSAPPRRGATATHVTCPGTGGCQLSIGQAREGFGAGPDEGTANLGERVASWPSRKLGGASCCNAPALPELASTQRADLQSWISKDA
jgi:hypothetical protein